ncbi:uncharacterized protein LOC144344887 isoform X3 [Saccoglossus kowalevskii]
MLLLVGMLNTIQIREKIMDQLRLKFDDKYSDNEYQFAIRRAYENKKIHAREGQNPALKNKNKMAKRLNTLRWQTMQRRMSLRE